jgi:hypothetical protein
VFSEVWEFQSTGYEFGSEDNLWRASDLLNQLQLHLASVCGSVRFRHKVRLARLYEEHVTKLVESSRTFSVVSFNYDTVVEQVLDRVGLGFVYGPESGVVFTDAAGRDGINRGTVVVPVYKLHGSVNWGVCRNCGNRGPSTDLINAFETPYFPLERRARCVLCQKRFLDAGIVPPVSNKGAALRSLEPIWTKARAAISRAREIEIVGYSLPESDRQAINLLRGVEGPLKRPRIRVICGERGAPDSYNHSFSRFDDVRSSFENYLESITGQ